jgi:hypothetical protein
MVSQDVVMLNDSLASNVSLGDTPDCAKVQQCLQEPLHQRVLHFLFGADREEVFRNRSDNSNIIFRDLRI